MAGGLISIFIFFSSATVLLEQLKICFTKLVGERSSEAAYIPATVRILVKILGIVYGTPFSGVEQVVYIKSKCGFVFQELFTQAQVYAIHFFTFTLWYNFGRFITTGCLKTPFVPERRFC